MGGSPDGIQLAVEALLGLAGNRGNVSSVDGDIGGRDLEIAFEGKNEGGDSALPCSLGNGLVTPRRGTLQ